MTIAHDVLESPLGTLTLVQSDEGLCRVALEHQAHLPDPTSFGPRRPGCAAEAARQLEAYFAGALEVFDLELAPSGTAFQHEVWGALEAVGFGATTTYGELAHHLGRAGAARAIGAAVGRNPLLIVVPCHRVLGAGGHLTGYAGGLEAKVALLELEGWAGP